MARFEIVEGQNYQETLNELRLDPHEVEELREALDWKLSREPESGSKVDTGSITIFYESYSLRPDDRLLIAYRLEGETVILEEVHRDISQDF
jgi:hypothetical protein